MATALLGEGGFSSRLSDNIDRLRPDGFGGSIHAADHGHYKLRIKDMGDSQALKWRLGKASNGYLQVLNWTLENI